MPNRRAANKAYLGGFVEKGFKAEISRAARRAGMANKVYGFALTLIQKPLKRRLAKLKRVRLKAQTSKN